METLVLAATLREELMLAQAVRRAWGVACLLNMEVQIQRPQVVDQLVAVVAIPMEMEEQLTVGLLASHHSVLAAALLMGLQQVVEKMPMADSS